MSSIEGIRKKIDQVDEKILSLLQKRAEYSKKICLLKIGAQIGIEQKKREKEALQERKKSATKKNLSESFTERLFKTIFTESKRIQQNEHAVLTKNEKNDTLLRI